MALWKRGDWYWTDFAVNGTRYRLPLHTTDSREAKRVEKEKIADAQGGKLAPSAVNLFGEVVSGTVIAIDEGDFALTDPGKFRAGKMTINVETAISWDPRGPDNLRSVYVTASQPEAEPDPNERKLVTQ